MFGAALGGARCIGQAPNQESKARTAGRVKIDLRTVPTLVFPNDMLLVCLGTKQLYFAHHCARRKEALDSFHRTILITYSNPSSIASPID